MYKKLCTLWQSVGSVSALEVVYVSLVLIHHGNAVQSLLCYSFNEVIVEEAVVYLLLFNWKYTAAWKRIGPSGGLHLEGHLRIQGRLTLPRGVHIWPGTPASEDLSLLGMRNNQWSLGSWVNGCPSLKSSYSRHSGWFAVLISICHRMACSMEAEEETTKSIGLALSSWIHT